MKILLVITEDWYFISHRKYLVKYAKAISNHLGTSHT